jgi:hypothetical protein
MTDATLPYVPSYGGITKVLGKIKDAQTPPRFTQDYLGTTLDMPGGTNMSLIPFLKRTGFLGSDGSPTDLYKRFRNPAQSGSAAAEAIRIGYRPLYTINEYVHNANDKDLKGLIVQATGAEADSRTVQLTIGAFKALKAFADFEAATGDPDSVRDTPESGNTPGEQATGLPGGINLGYTINLHLPSTSDIAVFNAIFRSLKEHILQ